MGVKLDLRSGIGRFGLIAMVGGSLSPGTNLAPVSHRSGSNPCPGQSKVVVGEGLRDSNLEPSGSECPHHPTRKVVVWNVLTRQVSVQIGGCIECR